MRSIRPGAPADAGAFGSILSESPEAAQWEPVGCLACEVTVAEEDGAVIGFLVTRTLDEGESEILNLAVSRKARRRGVARALLRDILERLKGDVYLEVRASNNPARMLYKSMGFEEVNTRPAYYSDPSEPGIVLKFHSC